MTMLFFLCFFFNKKQNIARRKTFHFSAHYGLPSLLYFCFVVFPDFSSSVFLVKRARASSGSISRPPTPRQEPPLCRPRTRRSVNGWRVWTQRAQSGRWPLLPVFLNACPCLGPIHSAKRLRFQAPDNFMPTER